MSGTFKAAYSGAADMLPYAGLGSDGNNYYCLNYPFTFTSTALVAANVLSSGTNAGGTAQVVARILNSGVSKAENSRTYAGVGSFSASTTYLETVGPGNVTIALCWGGVTIFSPVLTASISVLQ